MPIPAPPFYLPEGLACEGDKLLGVVVLTLENEEDGGCWAARWEPGLLSRYSGPPSPFDCPWLPGGRPLAPCLLRSAPVAHCCRCSHATLRRCLLPPCRPPPAAAVPACPPADSISWSEYSRRVGCGPTVLSMLYDRVLDEALLVSSLATWVSRQAGALPADCVGWQTECRHLRCG